MDTGGKIATGVLVPLAVIGAVIGGWFLFGPSTRKPESTRSRAQSLISDDGSTRSRAQSSISDDGPRLSQSELSDLSQELGELSKKVDEIKDRTTREFNSSQLNDLESILGKKGGKRRRKTRSKRHRSHKKRR